MGLFVALQFLTSLPLPWRRELSAGDLGRSQAYFPLVGLFIGVFLLALDWGLSRVLPLPVASALLVVALILVTGALHLDGLIDSCDGLFLPRSPAERLEVMRDSRAGSFGIAGAVMLLALKVTAMSALMPPNRLPALLLAPVLGRWAMVLALAAFPYARSAGKGMAFHGHGYRPLLVATLLAAAISFLAWSERGLLAMAAVALWAWLVGRFISSRLGGLTGDSYGAVGETAEVLVLIAATVAWRGWS